MAKTLKRVAEFPARLAFAVCLALVSAGLPLRAQQIEVNKNNRTIAITTSAESEAEADTAVVHIGFIAYGDDETTAYAAGSKASNAIMDALRSAGIAADAIQSADQSIAPVPPYNNQNWTEEEKAERKFQVQQSWTVKTAAKDAAKALDIAAQTGANQSGPIDWTVANDDALQAKAAGLALVRARQIAQQMAEGLHVALGGLIYASNEGPLSRVIPVAPMAMAMNGRTAKERIEPLAIGTKKITRSATVYAVFAIQ